MSFNRNFVLVFCVLSLAGVSSAKGRLRESFQHFFGDVEAEITRILAQNCSSELESYRKEEVILYGTWCVKTYSCVAENLSGYTSANMQASGVLLGLTPWILSTLGSRTVEMSLLSIRRPVLAGLLVLGSPAMMPAKPFKEFNPIQKLLAPASRKELRPSQITGPRSRIWVTVEFIFAIGSIVNLGTLSWQLGINTISTMSCDDSDTLVELWIALAIMAHLFGVVTFFLRAQISISENEGQWSLFKRARYWYGLQREGQLCVNQDPLNFEWGKESWKFIISSWLAAIYTVAHLTFGTAVLSSLSFVGVPDATTIAARFLASTIVCRCITAYELAGMRTAQNRRTERSGRVPGPEPESESPIELEELSRTPKDVPRRAIYPANVPGPSSDFW